jgi:hypothetical protein
MQARPSFWMIRCVPGAASPWSRISIASLDPPVGPRLDRVDGIWREKNMGYVMIGSKHQTIKPVNLLNFRIGGLHRFTMIVMLNLWNLWRIRLDTVKVWPSASPRGWAWAPLACWGPVQADPHDKSRAPETSIEFPQVSVTSWGWRFHEENMGNWMETEWKLVQTGFSLISPGSSP